MLYSGCRRRPYRADDVIKNDVVVPIYSKQRRYNDVSICMSTLGGGQTNKWHTWRPTCYTLPT